jgi:hypothetical protein
MLHDSAMLSPSHPDTKARCAVIYLISLSLSYLSLIYLEEESHCVLRLSPLDIHAVHAGVLTLEGLRCGAQARASRQNRTELFTTRNRDERATTNTATTVSNGETVKRQGSDIARNTHCTRVGAE